MLCDWTVKNLDKRGWNVKLDKAELIGIRILAGDIGFNSWQGPQETMLIHCRKLGKSNILH